MEKCNTASNCHQQGALICGVILLVIATILTLITLDGIAIFGMFIVGLLLCCHKKWRRGGECATECPCCDAPVEHCATTPKKK